MPVKPTPSEIAQMSDNDLVSLVKQDGSDAAMREIITRHSGAYINVVERYAGTGYCNLNDIKDERDVNMYDLVMRYDPTRGAKLSTFIHNNTRYLCQKARRSEFSQAKFHGGAYVKADKEYDSDTDGAAMHYAIYHEAPKREEEAFSADDIESILEQVAKEVYDQRFVTIARMRVFGDEKATLQQCGEALGVTRERARQIFDVDIPILRKIMSKELGCEWREPSE